MTLFTHISDSSTADFFRNAGALARHQSANTDNALVPVTGIAGEFSIQLGHGNWRLAHVGGVQAVTLALIENSAHPVAVVRALDALNVMQIATRADGQTTVTLDGRTFTYPNMEAAIRFTINRLADSAPTS